MKLDREVIHTMIEKAGYQCGKNTAMVDVFDRFSQLVIEHLKEQGSCQENTKPASKPVVKIEKAQAGSGSSQ